MIAVRLDKLDALRGAATLYIILHHFELYKQHPAFIVFGQGQVVVVFFFLLSGFLLGLTTPNTKELKIQFLVKKATRIYPIFVCSLLLTYSIASIAAREWLSPDWYNLIGHILNLQDLNRINGNCFPPYFDNTPLWYVAYIWWFYVLFFIVHRYSADKGIWMALGISLIGFFSYIYHYNPISHILSYFLIPWTGVELGKHFLQKNKLTPKDVLLPLGLCILMAALFLGVVLQDIEKGMSKFYRHPVIEFRHYFSCILLVLGFFVWRKLNFFGYKYLRPFSKISSISYALFVLHYPLLIRYQIFFPHNYLLNTLCGLAVLFSLAYLLEVKLQNYFLYKRRI